MKTAVFFDQRTSTLSYVPYDEETRIGVVIDPVLDFDLSSGRTWTESAETIARFLDDEGLQVPFVLDTHAHADHISAMPFFRQRFGAKTVIGADITKVQSTFADLFHLEAGFARDGSQFDVLLRDGDRLEVGPLQLEAIHTPGHTPACMSYRIGDALFVGDALFQPDYGTARCDFPGGSAEALYDSIDRLYSELPGETQTYTCHDYQPGGRSLEWLSSLREQRESNVQLSERTSREAFIAFRQRRDATLSMPKLMLPAVQLNIRAGQFPPPESNGVSYLKLPLDVFGRDAAAGATAA